MNWQIKAERRSSPTCSGGVGTSADKSIVSRVLLRVDVIRTKVGAVEVLPAA